jgi:hypothetical protein
MTLDDFKALKDLEDCRVRIKFADGQEVIATLVSATIDLDESSHLIYEKVEWSELPHANLGDAAYYAPGEEVMRCSLATDVSD